MGGWLRALWLWCCGVGLVGVIADGLVICDVGLGLILGLWTWLYFGDCDLVRYRLQCFWFVC